MAHIRLKNLSLDFPLFQSSQRSLKKIILNAVTGGRISTDARRPTLVHALKNLNIDIQAGDRVGLVGHNGSGKTTLLRVLAGVYTPTAGNLDVQGNISSLLDVSLGMDDEATGYENILLRGAMLGFSPSEMQNKVQAIADFTELGDALELPIRTYSSGMRMRLGFATSTAVHADIILMDEWLSVGDADFQAKAQVRLNEMVEQSQILVIASHDISLIDKLCNKVIHLEHGSIV